MMINDTEFERSQLHTKSMMDWFQSRHSTTTKETYTFLPDQIHFVKTLIDLFKQFDKDNSNSLDKQELFNLLRKYDIQLTQDELNSFFILVDKNHDRSLTLDEFKLCVSDYVANKHFTGMMEKIRLRKQDEIQEDKVEPLLTFQKVLNQITYLEQRADTINKLYNHQELIATRFQYMEKLLNLNKKIDVQLQYKPEVKNKTRYSYQKTSNIKDDVQQIVQQAKDIGIGAAKAEMIHFRDFALSERPNLFNQTSSSRLNQTKTQISSMKQDMLQTSKRSGLWHLKLQISPHLRGSRIIENRTTMSKDNFITENQDAYLPRGNPKPQLQNIKNKSQQNLESHIYIDKSNIQPFKLNYPQTQRKLDTERRRVRNLANQMNIQQQQFSILGARPVLNLINSQETNDSKKNSIQQINQSPQSNSELNRVSTQSKFRIRNRSEKEANKYIQQKKNDQITQLNFANRMLTDHSISKDFISKLRSQTDSAISFKKIITNVESEKDFKIK